MFFQHLLELFQIFDTAVLVRSSNYQLSEPKLSPALKVASLFLRIREMAELPTSIVNAVGQTVDADDFSSTSTAMPKPTKQHRDGVEACITFSTTIDDQVAADVVAAAQASDIATSSAGPCVKAGASPGGTIRWWLQYYEAADLQHHGYFDWDQFDAAQDLTADDHVSVTTCIPTHEETPNPNKEDVAMRC